MDDLLFGATSNTLCVEFSTLMSKEFEMSMSGKPNFFFGLQIKQCKSEIFINQGSILMSY